MDAVQQSRKPRADAERSSARILEAAEAVLAEHPAASLERIAAAAGLTRATVHRRFASRQALLEALLERLNERYLLGFEQSRVKNGPPMVALYRMSEIVFELKLSHRFSIELSADGQVISPNHSQEVVAGLELLFARLHAAGAITATDPAWCRRVYLALVHEVHLLPDDSPNLILNGPDPVDVVDARVRLLVQTLLGALGGKPDPAALIV
jgi:AcrR family transcriptional regulator